MLTPVLDTAEKLRERIRRKAVEGLTASFPLKLRDQTLELHDVKVHEKDYGPEDQKNALLQGASLHEPIRGTVVLKDASGRELEKVKNFTLMHLPFFTERHTFIVGGNEYQVANQIRMKPGVYTRKRANEEIESAFNLSKGSNFRLSLDPETGTPYMKYETTMIPLYPVLRGLGVPHADIAKAWGSEVAARNQAEFDKKQAASISKLYGKVLRPQDQVHQTHEERVAAIHKAYENTSMDPEVNQVTLGAAHEKVTMPAILDASRKLLNVYKSNEEVDDRDSLSFKTFHSVADFIKERLQLDSRALTNKVKLRATNKTAIREILPSAPFSPGIRSFLIGSQLSSIPTAINPVELIDHAVKVTSMGEGGIASERAIPIEARQVHSSHLGILDPVRTPESFSAGVDVRASMLVHRDEHGNLYTPVRDTKTGKFKLASPAELQRSTVMFPHQPKTGEVEAMDRGRVAHVPRSKCEYEFYAPAQFYSPAANLLPLMESMHGNRATMGSKYQTQALPLVDRDVPWVQSGAPFLGMDGKTRTLKSFESSIGHMIAPTSPVDGKVEKIDHQFIYVRPHGTKKAEESPLRLDDASLRPPVVLPPELLARIHRDYLGQLAGYQVFTVNGEVVRNEVDVDFSGGGNPARYGYVPENTLWVEYTSTLDAIASALRECVTCEAMRADGLKYPKAHATAAEVEKSFRDAHKDGAVTLSDAEVFLEQAQGEEVEKSAAAKSQEGLIKVPYSQNFPFASKTSLHHTLNVKPGDKVSEGQLLGDSNYTKDGTLAIGKNLRTAYMAYYGLNSNDAVVISEGAAKKLTSEHMYREVYDVDPDVTLGAEIHRAYFGTQYTAEQYRKLDSKGVVKKGQRLMPHDPFIVGVRKSAPGPTDQLLGNIKRSLSRTYREEVRAWDHDFEGEVIDVYQSEKRVFVTIRTQEPMRVGDKLSGRHGNKGVVSRIIPDHQMIQDEKGRPVDVLYTSQGVISRTNPSQILETALGKVAEKTGKPIILENFTGRNNVEYAKKLLKEHGLSDKETVTDPVSGKKIPGVFVGSQFTLRLFKTTDTNFSSRSTGSYDVNQQPSKGGTEGAKGIGMLEFNGLLAHNARNVLKESATIKSQKNEDFWRALQLGLPLPRMNAPFAYQKFIGMLQAAGIAVDKNGSKLTLKPMTDADTLKLSAGAIENEKLVKAKDLSPEKGGLFDPVITGGDKGTKWSHINLAEPLVNPVFTDPARRLLGMTTKAFEELHQAKGGAHVRSLLNKIDPAAREKELLAEMKWLKGADLDDAVKQVKYLRALQAQDLRPGDAYVISKLPVLPPIMRPILPTNQGGNLVVGDANELYRNAILHNKVLEAQVKDPILPPDEHKVLRQNLINAVGAVVGTNDTDNVKLQKRNVKGYLEHITGKTTPKSSFFQKKLMKRQQDVSGRGTIAPDGALGMDQVGLPEDMLWGTFSKFVIARLVRQGFGALQAQEMVENKHPAARDALLAETRERPVMVNRAPSLHRYNVVGAYAVPTPGKTITVNPFIEQGTSADYDGDTFQVHAPVTYGAVEEVKKMTLSNLIFGDRAHDDLMVAPRMEAVLGVVLASKEGKSKGKVHKFKTKADAMAAYKRGEVTLQDLVEITGS